MLTRQIYSVYDDLRLTCLSDEEEAAIEAKIVAAEIEAEQQGKGDPISRSELRAKMLEEKRSAAVSSQMREQGLVVRRAVSGPPPPQRQRCSAKDQARRRLIASAGKGVLKALY